MSNNKLNVEDETVQPNESDTTDVQCTDAPAVKLWDPRTWSTGQKVAAAVITAGGILTAIAKWGPQPDDENDESDDVDVDSVDYDPSDA